MGLPVLADPSWSRAAFPVRNRCGKHSKQNKFERSKRSAGPTNRPAHKSSGGLMYAVIRAGGKQYKVAPGDVIRVEKVNGTDGQVEFGDVLAVSSEAGSVVRPGGEARVTGEIVDQGRGDKVIVFHYKRKKQYKKLRGHRQDFTAVRITEIAVGGQSFKAPELPKKEAKPKKVK